MRHVTSFAVLFVVLSVGVSASRAATLHVPTEYPTIQDGIDAAAYGDTVLVAAGTYTDCPNGDCGTAVAVMREGLTLRSEEGPGATTLEAQGPSSTKVVDAIGIGAGGATISGFRITSGDGQRTGLRGLDSVRLTIRDCVFEDLTTGVSVNTIDGEAVLVSDCVFRRLIGSVAIEVSDCYVTVDRCTFEACAGGHIVSFWHGFGRSALLRDCAFTNNESTTVVGVLDYEHFTMEGCDLWDNVGHGVVVRPPGSGEATIRECLFVGGAGSRAAAGGSLGDGRVAFIGNTAVGNVGTETSSGAAFHLASRNVVFRDNIIAHSDGGPAVTLSSLAEVVDEGCNIFWENEAGHFSGDGPAPSDFQVDPLFCDPQAGDYRLRADSPALPQNHMASCPERIGALGEGCPGGGAAIVGLAADPMGPYVTMDGVTAQAPELYLSVPGASHLISTESLQDTGAGVRFLFHAWSDGGPIEHTIPVSAGYSEFTATFDTEYFLTTTADSGGVALGQTWGSPGTVHSIVAAPDSGYFFDRWVGAGSGSYSGQDNPASVTLDGPVTEVALFLPLQYPLEVGVYEGNGVALPESGLRDIFSTVTIEAIPGPGYEFAWWLGSGLGSYSGSMNPATVTMYGPITQQAVFDPVLYLLDMEPPRAGSVTPESGLVEALSTVAIEAYPGPGFVFREWIGTGDGSYSGSDNPAAITMNGPITQRAEFDTVVVPPPPYLGYEFTLSLSDTDPHVHTGDPVGLGSVYLWLDCTTEGKLGSLDLELTGTLQSVSFTPSPGILASLDESHLELASPGCVTPPAVLGQLLVLPPGDGWLCIPQEIDAEPVVARSCGALRRLAWPNTVRFTGVCTDGGIPCATGIGCDEPLPFVTGVETAPPVALPAEDALLGAFPNPFARGTSIRYALSRPTTARLHVYDVTGRLVRTLVDEARPGGIHDVDWNGRNASGEIVPAGIYFVRFEGGDVRAAHKLVRLSR